MAHANLCVCSFIFNSLKVSALQQTRGQLLKVSDQISVSLRDSQEQLEEARADAAELRAQLLSTRQLLQHANETLLIKVRTRNLARYHQPGGGA